MQPSQTVALAEDVRLIETAQEIEREHQATIAAGASMVEHAIACGAALIYAKEIVGHGGWEDWLRETFPDRHVKTHRTYMRLARHQDRVRFAGARTIKDAHRLLAGEAFRPYQDAVKDEARELASQGMSNKAIARELGIADTTVALWLDADKAQAKREIRGSQTQDALRASRQAERDALVKEHGGPLEYAYARLRVAAQTLAETLETAQVGAQMAAMQLALTKVQQAEDQIVKAVKS